MDLTISDLSREIDRGQVDIETLIIFIAMVLLAATAASVLVTTAGYLQNQAPTTSEGSESQVSNQVLVIDSIGEIDKIEQEAPTTRSIEFEYRFGGENSTSGDGDTVTFSTTEDGYSFDPSNGDLIVKDSSGNSYDWTGDVGEVTSSTSVTLDSQGLNSDERISITWQTEIGSDVTWTFDAASDGETASNPVTAEEGEYINEVGKVDMTVMQWPGANEIDLEGASIEYIGPDGGATLGYAATAMEGNFTVEGTTDPDNTAPVLTSRQDRFTITVELVNDDSSDLRNLKEGEKATILIVTQDGSQTVTIINVTQSLSSYNDEDHVKL